MRKMAGHRRGSKSIIQKKLNEWCAKCGTRALDGNGGGLAIGPFCPNKNCDNLDGPMVSSPRTPKRKKK